MKKLRKLLQNIYKKIIYNFFFLFYGKIKSVNKPSKKNEIFVEKIQLDKKFYKIYFCKYVSLYTDTIHDTAIIKDNNIIEGPSFQYRNNINSFCKLNSVFQKGTPRFKKKINGSVLSLLVGGAGNSNYWHWLFDVLPKLHIFNNSRLKVNEIDYYLLPNIEKSFQIETLDLLNVSRNKRLSSKYFRHITANKLFIVDHPYNLTNNPFKDPLNIPLWIIKFLRKNFMNKLILDSYKNKIFPDKIYINRKDGHTLRYIINEEEIEFKLKKNGFASITMSDYSFIDQVKIFNNAKTIIGLHGAAFANLVFCRPSTKILEIKPDNAGDMFKNLAILNKLSYKDVTLKPLTINIKNQTGDLYVKFDLLDKLLKEI